MNSDLTRFLKEDYGHGDITSELLFPTNLRTKAVIITRETGIIAGCILVNELFQELDLVTDWHFQDGDTIKENDRIVSIEGSARHILALERTSLNILGHMSGIATNTKKAVDTVKKINPFTDVAATRKTLPGLRQLEKYSVIIGGGLSHRYDLHDMIIVKDTHLKLGKNIDSIIKLIKEKTNSSKKIEIETTTIKDAIKAAQLGADIIMLDNMTVDDVKKTISTIKQLHLSHKIIFEVSGGINFSNLKNYASTNVDIISMGYLTHSSKSLDFSLKII
tara:strand:- start:263 stop:1093 length:831 start_codon:yes stop_codon:yes gene_type:complete